MPKVEFDREFWLTLYRHAKAIVEYVETYILKKPIKQ